MDSAAPAEGESTREFERLFVALALPDPVKASLSGLTEPIRGMAWTQVDQLHVTLRFLGDVPVRKIEGLAEHLAMVHVEPFLLPVEGLGAFPLKGPPRVVWAGTGDGHPHLYQLRQRLDDAILAAGIDLDVRTFQPHVTLARCTEKAAMAATQWLRHHREFLAPPFRVEAFDLYASELLPAGARHTLKRRFPLGQQSRA